MKSLNFLYTLLATAVAVTAAPSGHCNPSYNISRYTLDFEDIYNYCHHGPCAPFVKKNIVSPRGQGVAYTKYYPTEMQKPLLIPNVAAWVVFNCTAEEYSSSDERFACGNKGSTKALYSPGKSPYDPKIKPRLGTLDFPETYITGAIESFYITPLRLPTGTKKASFELIGTKTDKTQVKHTVQLNTSKEKRILVKGLVAKGFKNLKVLEMYLSAGGKGGYEFALDDLVLDEYRTKPTPPGCTPPTPTMPPVPGACVPAPAPRTSKWRYDAEDMPPNTYFGDYPYKSINWPFMSVQNDTSNLYFYPPHIIPPSGKNWYQGWGSLTFWTYLYERRFGVQSLWAACSFQQPQFPDPDNQNNAPCILTFIGRRDPYDGDGLPDTVVAKFEIPNPGNKTGRHFTQINLDTLTPSPGTFTRLYSFTLHARQGLYDAGVALDDLVFTRAVGPDERKCRAPGWSELNFDDINVGSGVAKIPSNYKGFKFDSSWGVTSSKNFPARSPGKIASKSPFNALWSGRTPDTPNEYPPNAIDGYINPLQNQLFIFEEAVITLDLPEYTTNASVVNDVAISFSVKDACGSSTYQYPYPPNPIDKFEFYYKTISRLGKIQFTFALPLKAISSIQFYAYRQSGNYERVNLFIDNFRYRKFEGIQPGCASCGYRGGDWCEVPHLTVDGVTRTK